MRGLLSAVLLLAPALISADAPPREQLTSPAAPIDSDIPDGSATATFSVPFPHGNHPSYEVIPLVFTVKVRPATPETCGYDAITVNDQPLSVSKVHPTVFADGDGIINSRGFEVGARWRFNCKTPFAHNDRRTFRLYFHSVNGENVDPSEMAHISVTYVQDPQKGIVDLFVSTRLLQNPYLLHPAPAAKALPVAPGHEGPRLEKEEPIVYNDGEDVDNEEEVTSEDLDEDIAELRRAMVYLQAVENRILKDKEELELRKIPEAVLRVGDCDNAKCVFKALHQKVRCTLRRIHRNFGGGHKRNPYGLHWHDLKKHRHGGNDDLPDRRRPSSRLPMCRLPSDHPPIGRTAHKKPLSGPVANPQRVNSYSSFVPATPPDTPARFGRPIGSHPHSPAGPHNRYQQGQHVSRQSVRVPRIAFASVIVACILLFVHRYFYSPARRAAAQARREARLARRKFNHERRARNIRRMVSRITGKPVEEFNYSDFEKTQAMMEEDDDGESVLSTTMSDEITRFSAAVGAIGDMVKAEPHPAPHAFVPPPRIDSLPPIKHETEKTEPPAYEPSDVGSDSSLASEVKYTPESTEYTPSEPAQDHADDISGSDAKN